MTDGELIRVDKLQTQEGADPERIWIPIEQFKRILFGGGYTRAEIKRLIEKLRVSERHVCLTK